MCRLSRYWIGRSLSGLRDSNRHPDCWHVRRAHCQGDDLSGSLARHLLRLPAGTHTAESFTLLGYIGISSGRTGLVCMMTQRTSMMAVSAMTYEIGRASCREDWRTRN